jgi:hypothetical protein
MKRKMNKKFVAFLIPLLLLPMISFGYAHFTDRIVKQYKIHVGSLEIGFEGIHVDYAKMPDVNCNGIIWEDELLIETFENPDDCTWYISITANPITGGFILNTTMWLHNDGKLPFRLDWEITWDGPYDDDPCFGPPYGNFPLTSLPMPPWSYDMDVYKWHQGVRSGPYSFTQTLYHPCDYIEIKQHVNFEQPEPGDPDNWQKDWQCKWIRIFIRITAIDEWEELGSETVGIIPTP